MPTDPRKRQKKQERRAAKRKSKHRELVRAKNAGLPEQLTAAARYPVLHCWVTDNLQEQGLGWVCLSRELPNGSVAFAVFLIDRYCLGVKDAWGAVRGRFTYDSEIARKMRLEFKSKDIQPACARKLVEAAVEYAAALGLRPHPDYHKAKAIFGGIDAGECTEEFEFGQDGKPHFIAGPNDDPARCRQILSALEQSRGVGRFHYTIPISGDTEILAEGFGDDDGAEELGADESGGVRKLEWEPSEDEGRSGGQP
jgi:hypothetical protein